MRKIFTLFAAMLVAASMVADPVVLPDTLDVDNVSFRSEGMPNYVITEGDTAGTYFDMGPNDSSNDTLLYAEWDVKIQPLKYNIAVDVYNTNSWSVQIYLLTQAGDTVKSLRYKGSSGQKGQFSIGSLDLSDLQAGNYKLRARAATAWSAMKLKDVIFTVDYKGVRVALPGTLQPAYAELSSGASVSNNAIAFTPSTAPDEYATWNVSFAAACDFKVSIDITASNGHDYCVALYSADGTSRIDSVEEGSQKSDTGVKELGTIAVPAAGNYIVKLTNAIKWSEAVLNNIVFDARTLYLKISDDWKYTSKYAVYYFDDSSNGWSDFMKLVEGEEDVYTTIIPSDYSKIIFVRFNSTKTSTGNWDDKWSQTVNLEIPASKNLFTITSGGTGQECNGSWSKYNYESTLVDGWYLVGTFNSVEEWTVEKLTAAKKFVVNPSEASELIVTITLANGDEFKAAYVYQDEITEIKPAGTGNNYVVDSNHAGVDKTIYYSVESKGTWGGHFYVEANGGGTSLDNVLDTEKTVKAIENGQLVIIKNGVRYNVLGTVIK